MILRDKVCIAFNFVAQRTKSSAQGSPKPNICSFPGLDFTNINKIVLTMQGELSHLLGQKQIILDFEPKSFITSIQTLFHEVPNNLNNKIKKCKLILP